MLQRPDILARLIEDHVTVRRVLAKLELEIDRVAQYHKPDTAFLDETVRYFGAYMSAVHHAVEELIHSVLKRRAPFRAAEVDKIAVEHGEGNTMLAQFAEAARYLAATPETSRFAFCRAARGFVAFERHHLRREEARFFVYAREYLTPSDWETVTVMAHGLGGLSTPEAALHQDGVFQLDSSTSDEPLKKDRVAG